MKIKIQILLFTLYLSAFYKFVVEYVPGLESLGSYINLAIDVIIAYLGISSIPKASKRTLTGLFLFFAASTLTFILNSGANLTSHINGVREVATVFCMFTFFSTVLKAGYLEEFNRRFIKFVYIFLALQLPTAFLEYKKYGSGDQVGGTFGTVGGSGVLSLSIFLLVYYLIENKGNRRTLMAKTKHLVSLFFFFIPIFINETKISFLLIPLMIATFISLKQFKSSLLLLIFTGIFLVVFASLYTDQNASYSNPIAEIFNPDFLQDYLDGDVVAYEDVPRITKLQLGWSLLSKTNSTLFLGEEYGAFKGGTTIARSAFTEKYNWMLNGTVPYLFYLFVTGGIALVALVIWLVFAEIFSRNRFYRNIENYSSGLLFFIGVIFLMMLFYNDAFRTQCFLIIFVFLIYYSKFFSPDTNELPDEEEQPA